MTVCNTMADGSGLDLWSFQRSVAYKHAVVGILLGG